MKTAMQELIDNLESIDINVPNGVKLIFIEKEKQQIKKAYKDGRICIKPLDVMVEEEYYNRTYNQNKS
jgi:hypothetical protein